MRVSPGVVAALYWSVNMYTQPGDSVIIMTPVYYPFHNCVKDSGRNLVTCDLIYDQGVYTIDYEGFEKAIVENGVKMYILCSPHNPAGRVWKEEELERMLEICARHNVLAVSYTHLDVYKRQTGSFACSLYGRHGDSAGGYLEWHFS